AGLAEDAGLGLLIRRKRAGLAVDLHRAHAAIFERADQLGLGLAAQHAHLPGPVEQDRLEIPGSRLGGISAAATAAAATAAARASAAAEDPAATAAATRVGTLAAPLGVGGTGSCHGDRCERAARQNSSETLH